MCCAGDHLSCDVSFLPQGNGIKLSKNGLQALSWENGLFGFLVTLLNSILRPTSQVPLHSVLLVLGAHKSSGV